LAWRLAAAGLLLAASVARADDRAHAFDIEAQSLGTALIEFAQQADVVFVSRGELMQGRRSGAVQGVLTAAEALEQLLEGSGLSGEIDAEGVLVLRPHKSLATSKPDDEDSDMRPAQPQKNFLTTLVGSVAGLAAAIIGAGAPADAAMAQSRGYVLEEVVVTARRVEESLQRSPVSITNVTGDALFERDLGDISGVANLSPNVNFSFGGTTSGSDSAAVVYIRGVGQNDFTPVTDPGVGIYVDGVYLARSVGSVLDALDLERVEVLKGPQGTVFGRNTIGGAINLITRDPGDKLAGRLRFTTGEDDRYELFGSVDLPITPTLRSNITGMAKIRDGYVKRRDGVDLGDDDVITGRVKLVWEPTENLSFNLATDYTRLTEESAPEVALEVPESSLFPTLFNANAFGNGSIDPACAGGGSLANPNCANDQFVGEPFTSYETGPSRSNLKAWGVALTGQWNVGDIWGLQDVSVKSITSRRGLDADLARASDATPFLIFQTQDPFKQSQLSQEVQVFGDAWNNRVHWVGGFFYFTEQGSQFGLIEAVPPNFPRLIGGKTDNDSWSVFAEAVIDVTDRLRLIGGIRHTDETKRFDGTAVTLPGAIAQVGRDFLLGDAAGEDELEFSEQTWRAGAMYDFTDTTMGYFTASRGFKSGGFDLRITQDAFELPKFDPEFVTMYEFGVKNEFPQYGLRLNASVFYSEYSDVQVSANPPGQINTVTANAADGEVIGVEIDATWVPRPQLLIEASFGFQDAEYTEINAASNVEVSKSDDFIRTPPFSWSFGASYRIDLADVGGFGINGTLTPRLDWIYRDETAFEPVNTGGTLGALVTEDGYHNLDLSVAYRDPSEKWLVQGGVHNVTDERYLIAGDTNDTIGYVLGTFARERNWFLSIERAFD